MNYKETLDYMFTKLPMYQRTGKAAYKANLDTTLALDAYFNHPHREFKSIHVAGTNGKGSVSHAVASILQSAGYKVGLYTSPHLRDFRERIKINGEMIPENQVIKFIEEHHKKFEELSPSFFEMTVAMAFHYFANQKIDIAVVEVGLGGRLDSTNIIDPLLSVITNISKDHTNLLGDDIVQIAAEKAGIIKNGVPLIVGEKQKETSPVFERISADKNTSLVYSDEKYEIKQSELTENKRHIIYNNRVDDLDVSVFCDLLGSYQLKNMRTVLCVCDELILQGMKIPKDAIKHGLTSIVENTGLLGRWYTVSKNPLVICDTGHNVAGIKEIILQIDSMNYGNLHIVFGLVNDKNIDDVLALLPKNASYYFTRADIPRALDQNELAERAKTFNLLGKPYKTVCLALQSAKENSTDKDLIFVGGSTFVVAEVV